MNKLQRELIKAHQIKQLKTFPSIIEKKQCSHGETACMTPGCNNCCDDLLYLWMYDLAPVICKKCFKKLQSKESR